jgi:hypothetical protein
MSEAPKDPAFEPVKDEGGRNKSALNALPCPAASSTAQTAPAPRGRRQAASRKPRRLLSPEEEAARLIEVRRRRKERIAAIDVANLPEVLEAPEVALLLRVSENKVYESARCREIPCAWIRGCLRFSKSAVLGWLGAQGPDPLSSKRG